MRALRKAVKASLHDAGIAELARGEQLVGIGGTVRNLAKIDLAPHRPPAAAAARLPALRQAARRR